MKYYTQKSEITGKPCAWRRIGGGATVVVSEKSVTVYDFEFSAENYTECTAEEFNSVLKDVVLEILNTIL